MFKEREGLLYIRSVYNDQREVAIVLDEFSTGYLGSSPGPSNVASKGIVARATSCPPALASDSP